MLSLERVEKLFRLLLPPAAREHVLGDLHQKCKSRREYVATALPVLGCVVFSRIRRTTDFQVFLMETLTVYLAFSTAAWWLGQRAFLYNHAGFIRLAIPTTIIVLGVLVSNAYADPAKQRGWSQTGLECAGCISIAFLAGSFVMPFQILLYGSCLSLVLLSTLRMLFPPILNGPSSIALRSPEAPMKWRSAILVAAVFAIVVLLAIRR